MTFGDKIRKYRKLKKLNQKQLGEQIGFKSSTADVRINQYETGKMCPKSDIKAKLAKCLDVDIEALSNINIQSFKDVMYILFELEESYGLKIDADTKNKKHNITLSFDKNSSLYHYISYWIDKKAEFENPEDYEKWKARFFTNFSNDFKESSEEMTVGEKIKYLRLQKGMTQKELSIKTGIDGSTIRKYESGKLKPKSNTLIRIADAMGIDSTELIIMSLYSNARLLTGADIKQIDINDVGQDDVFICIRR